MEVDIEKELQADRVPFVIAWEPIVKPPENNNATRSAKIVAGQIHLLPKSGADPAEWWQTVMASDRGEMIQSTVELLLSGMADRLDIVSRWHLALHPQVRPRLRIDEILDLWNAQKQVLNLVYMLPVDDPVEPAVWEEIAAVKRAKQIVGERPMLAASHVGRSGLSRELAAALNDGPFSVLHLDPSVSAGLTGRMDIVPGNDERFGALSDFMQVLDSRIPVIATGLQTDEEWRAVEATGVHFGQGPLWMAPDPIHNTFGTPVDDDPRTFTWPGTGTPDWKMTPTARLHRRARSLDLGGPILPRLKAPPGVRVAVNGRELHPDDPDYALYGTPPR